MTTEHELTPQECYERLQSHAGGIGRLAVVTPLGPAIYPLNFTVDAHAIVFRTSAYSELGQLVRDSDVAFEIDAIDWGARRGWSVVLKGRAEAVDDPDEIGGRRGGGGCGGEGRRRAGRPPEGEGGAARARRGAAPVGRRTSANLHPSSV